MNNNNQDVFTWFVDTALDGLETLGETILIIFDTPYLRFWLWLGIIALVISFGFYADTHPSLNNGEW